jgi:tetratricopeptide (TPR) repeat protein
MNAPLGSTKYQAASGANALLLCLAMTIIALAQPPRAAAPSPESAAALTTEPPLDPVGRAAYKAAIERRDYTKAESILVNAINSETATDPKSKRAAQLLLAAAELFFLNGEWLNTAISLKKVEAIQALGERTRFTLAMAYIRLSRVDWARSELAKLSREFPKNALYLYWQGRLDYDAQQYTDAIAKYERVIALDPDMMRAYDNLGLCYDYLGRFDEAVKYFSRAVELNRKQPQPSPWPHLNLGITLLSQNKIPEAISSISEALRYNNRLPQAHYQLGLALEKQGKTIEAISEFIQAVEFDATYPEPHYNLGLLYQKLGEKEKAQSAFATFQQLKQTVKPK